MTEILRRTPSPRTAKIKTLTALKFEICGYKEINRYEVPSPPPQISLCPCKSKSLHSTLRNCVSISVQSTVIYCLHHNTPAATPPFQWFLSPQIIPSVSHSISHNLQKGRFLSDFMFQFTTNLKQAFSTSSFISLMWVQVDVGLKVNLTSEQAMKVRKGSRNIALLFLWPHP
jgi:hypothetical protein